MRFNGKRYEVGLKTTPAVSRKVKKRYQETFDTDVNAGYIREVGQTELNQTKDKLHLY